MSYNFVRAQILRISYTKFRQNCHTFATAFRDFIQDLFLKLSYNMDTILKRREDEKF